MVTTSVLLIDDDRATVRQLQSALVKQGYRVSLSLPGLQAIRQMLKDEPDLVVLGMDAQQDDWSFCRRLLTFLDRNTGLEFILASLVILGLGFGFFSSPNTNAIMGSVEKKFYGVAGGTLSTMRVTGQMLSMGTAMLLFALYMGRVQITLEYYPLFLRSARTAFIIFAVLGFGGIFASLARGKTR